MTKELDFCKAVFNLLGKFDGILLLERSNLNEREVILLTHRFIRGLSLKETAELSLLEEDTVNKFQLRTCKKLYNWIQDRGGVDYIIHIVNQSLVRRDLLS